MKECELVHDLASKQTCSLTFLSHAFEIAPLISILRINFVGVDRSSDIVLLDYDPIEIDKGLGNHVEPFVRKSLGLILESISEESSPS